MLQLHLDFGFQCINGRYLGELTRPTHRCHRSSYYRSSPKLNHWPYNRLILYQGKNQRQRSIWRWIGLRIYTAADYVLLYGLLRIQACWVLDTSLPCRGAFLYLCCLSGRFQIHATSKASFERVHLLRYVPIRRYLDCSDCIDCLPSLHRGNLQMLIS